MKVVTLFKAGYAYFTSEATAKKHMPKNTDPRDPNFGKREEPTKVRCLVVDGEYFEMKTVVPF